MAETNGHARPRLSVVEREVLELLEHCSPAFLGWLKVTHIGEVQRQLRGVRPTGTPEPDAGRDAGRPPG
jgi:hypothetical protein